MTEADTRTSIRVGGEGGYDVVVGRGTLGELADALGTGPKKVLVVHPSTLGARAAALREALADR